MRTDQNTGTVGSLNVLGATRLTTLEAAESRFSNPNGTAATLVGDLVLNGDLQLDGGNLTGLGEARFVNPQHPHVGRHSSEYVGPGGGGVGDGQLRLNNDDGVVIETSARVTGDIVGLGRLGGQSYGR